MAQIPTPRSFPQVLGDMVDTFLSKLGLRKLKVGSPVLSILESAAMSDVRNSQDIFNLLNSQDIGRASGLALDRIGNSEDLPRRQESLASGLITITDTSFEKVATKLYPGKPAPIAGSTTIYLSDASAMPALGGNIYIGRETANYEGSLTYSSVVDSGAYWTMTLTTPTTLFHNTSESVILAQGGNRQINANTVVQTQPNNIVSSVQYSTLYLATIPDGETQASGIIVVAKQPGVSGNVPAGAINSFTSAPFSGASVTNESPIGNGRATESDNDYRERIKDERASRSLATPLAIKTKILGLTAPDEAKRITSASVIRRQNYPTTVYIDDGTGYEERSSNQAIEVLAESAFGGEEYFQTNFKPIAKAFVASTGVSPFDMSDSARLAVLVGGIRYEHEFLSNDFRDLSSATAAEIASSINADSSIEFSARTSDGGQRVVILAKSDENEDIQVTTPDDPDVADANDSLLFPTHRADTLRLYKNDRLLSKDGQLATLQSNDSGSWATFSGSKTLIMSVDGTPALTYTFTDQDFIDNNTGYITVGKNTPAAWAKVINAIIPGVTATATSTSITLTSNADRSNNAALSITGGTLLAVGMWDVSSATGSSSDYSLDRNIGQIRLETPLAAGDRLTAGTPNNLGFFESDAILPVTIAGAGANIYVAVDGDAQIIETGITSSNTFDISKPSTGAWGAIYRITANPSSAFFDGVEVGDWAIIWDSDAAWTSLRGMWRILNSGNDWIEIQYSDVGGIVAAGVSFAVNGFAIVRYHGQMQKINVPVGTNYTAETLADAINNSIVGGEAYTFLTNKLRIKTNSYVASGDIAVVTGDVEGDKLSFDYGSYVENRVSHLPAVESGSLEIGTPSFFVRSISSSADANTFIYSGSSVYPDRMVVGLKEDSGVVYGNNKDFWSPIELVTSGGFVTTIDTRKNVANLWLPEDRFYFAEPFAIAPKDSITVVADGDATNKRFSVPMWRALRPVGGTYGITNTFKDIGDGTLSPTYLATAFGKDFDFNDFAVFMKARAKSHSADATRSVLWRSKEWGLGGEQVNLAYAYPATPDTALATYTDPLYSGDPSITLIKVKLPSDVQKTGYPVRNSTSIGYGYSSSTAVPSVTLCIGFPISSATRVGTTVTLTLTLPTPGGPGYNVTNHGLGGSQVMWVQSSDPNFPSGAKTVASASATTVTYTEAGAAVTTPNIGTLSFDTAGEALFSGASPSAIAVGDLVHVGDGASIPSDYRNQTIRISFIGPQYVQGYSETDLGATDNTTISTWSNLSNASLLKFYPLKTASCTATAIVASINALGAICPVTATVLGTGIGTVLLSSRDSGDVSYPLVDGINWVRTTVNPPDLTTDYQLTFKSNIDASLVSGSDWNNEEVRLVPITAQNIKQWMMVPGLSGLFTYCDVVDSDQGKAVQIVGKTPGVDGSVQVQGGTANSASASIQGTAMSQGTYSVATLRASDTVGLAGGHWVSLDNTVGLQKTGIIDATTALTSITTGGVFTLSAGPALYTEYVADALVDQTVSIEKHGRFICIANGSGFTTASEGDWIYITTPTTPGSDIHASNRGIFRIVRVTANEVFIENDLAVEETAVKCDIRFFTANSLMPGDSISINTSLWNMNNMGNWVVAHVGTGGTLFNSTSVFRVELAPGQSMTAVGAVAALGATESQKVVIVEGTPRRQIKRIHSISPNQTDPSLNDVKFDTAYGMTSVSEAAGTVLTALDKLRFSTRIAQGTGGYSYNTGLIQEAARVIYGDERDAVNYGGVAAAGDVINIMGPLVKRISVSLGIRPRLGVPTNDIADQVRSSVTAIINETPIGTPIAMSDIVATVSKINGVAAVTILSPTYGVGNDLISVQPYEKPLVISVEQDILVSFIGE